MPLSSFWATGGVWNYGRLDASSCVMVEVRGGMSKGRKEGRKERKSKSFYGGFDYRKRRRNERYTINIWSQMLKSTKTTKRKCCSRQLCGRVTIYLHHPPSVSHGPVQAKVHVFKRRFSSLDMGARCVLCYTTNHNLVGHHNALCLISRICIDEGQLWGTIDTKDIKTNKWEELLQELLMRTLSE